MSGDATYMIVRQLLARIIIPLVILGIAVGCASGVAYSRTLPTKEATQRDDSTYMQAIVNVYPAMKYTFTITNVEIKKQHWVVVTVKNKKNNDTLTTLLYDPTQLSTDLHVISGPSTRTDYSLLMSPANVPLRGTRDA